MFEHVYKCIFFMPIRIPLGLFTYLYDSPSALSLAKDNLSVMKISLYFRTQKET